MPDLETLALVVGTFFVGGLVKGTIGLGLPIVVLSLLALSMPMRDAMAVFLLPGIASNLWQATNGPWLRPLARRMWSFLAAAIVGIAVGVTVLAGAPSGALAITLGVLLLVYSGYALLAPRLPPPGRHERWMSPVAGCAGGVFFGMSGLFIVPGLLYLESLRMGRDEFVQAMGLTFVTISTALALAMASHALITWPLALTSASGLVPVFAGLALGRHLRHRISETGFRRVFFFGLIGVGLYHIARSAFGGL